MWWPVTATDDILAITGYGDITCIIGNLHFGDLHFVRHLPQVDLGQLAIAPHGVPEAAGILGVQLVVVLGSLEHMYRVTGGHMSDNLFRVAVDNRDLADVTLDNQEEILPVAAVQRLGRIVFWLNENLTALLHQRDVHLRWNRWLHLNIGGHQLDIFRWHDVIEIVHATLGAEGDDLFQAFLAKLHCVFRFQVLTRGTLAQGTVAAGTTLEVDGFSFFKILFGEGGFGGGYVYGETRQRDAYGYSQGGQTEFHFFHQGNPQSITVAEKIEGKRHFLSSFTRADNIL